MLNGIGFRDMAHPNNSANPESIGGAYYHDYKTNKSDSYGVHTNPSILSRVAYLIENGDSILGVSPISNPLVAQKIWYRSLVNGYTSKTDFYDVRLNVLEATKKLGLSVADISRIESAFDAVNIKKDNTDEGSSYFKPAIKYWFFNIFGEDGEYVDFSKNLTGRTLIADLDTAPSNDSSLSNEVQYISASNNLSTLFCNDVELIATSYAGLGTASGIIKDAISTSGVSGLTLNFRKGLNNTNYAEIISTSTSLSGGAYTTNLQAGNYCVGVVDNRMLSSETNRYQRNYFNIKVLGGVTISNQNGIATNQINGNQVRIILTWGQYPSNLDSHITGPTINGSTFHVYYGQKSYSENGIQIANLDVDDTSSYGPETTTLYNPNIGIYNFYVYNYSGSPAISTSSAKVQVFFGNSAIPFYTFSVPNGTGRTWNVFKYNSATKTIIPTNTMS